MKETPQPEVICNGSQIGEVDLIALHGDDDFIVRAARMSFSRGEDSYSALQNKALIRYLYRNEHTSPFEMVDAVFRIKAPLFVSRQFVRHRTAKLNEVSRRYVDTPPEFYIPTEYNSRADNVKQGAGDVVGETSSSRAYVSVVAATKFADYSYDYLLHPKEDEGEDFEPIAPEQARMVLPLNTQTEWVWKMDLHNLLHFLTLRLDSHAQLEIRVFAQKILEWLHASGQLEASLGIFEEVRQVRETLRNLMNSTTYKNDLSYLNNDIGRLL